MRPHWVSYLRRPNPPNPLLGMGGNQFEMRTQGLWKSLAHRGTEGSIRYAPSPSSLFTILEVSLQDVLFLEEGIKVEGEAA